jgi:hypothetical protein
MRNARDLLAKALRRPAPCSDARGAGSRDRRRWLCALAPALAHAAPTAAELQAQGERLARSGRYSEAIEACASKSSLSDLAPYTGPLTADPSDRLWVTSAGQLAAVDPAQGEPQRTFQITDVRALIANETYVFVLQDGGPDVVVWPLVAPTDAAPRRIRTGGMPRAMALDSEALYVAELAGRIVRIAVLPNLGEPEEIAVGLPKLDAIAISGDRIYLIADHRLVAWLPKS